MQLIKSFALVLGLAACNGGGVDEGSACDDDRCVCIAGDACQHDCSAGGNDCEVQCAANQDCDVGCAAGEPCDVECSSTTGCTVDCAGTDCDVTCPATGCTVTNCEPGMCDVTCGNIALPSRNGSTATCP